MNTKDLSALGLRIRSIRPSSQTTYRYYVIETRTPDTEWERWSEHSFDTRAQAVRYVVRNY
jgi:hypothetical protein